MLGYRPIYAQLFLSCLLLISLPGLALASHGRAHVLPMLLSFVFF